MGEWAERTATYERTRETHGNFVFCLAGADRQESSVHARALSRLFAMDISAHRRSAIVTLYDSIAQPLCFCVDAMSAAAAIHPALSNARTSR
ncbi:hypothetical protein C4K27_2753 [Pseudomonas chlororaphis subsp. chlororaphis]|nr:hypothetical protein C4K27_2753 [Pseudomonas chlororaphis subsp. chlororaphis]